MDNLEMLKAQYKLAMTQVDKRLQLPIQKYVKKLLQSAQFGVFLAVAVAKANKAFPTTAITEALIEYEKRTSDE